VKVRTRHCCRRWACFAMGGGKVRRQRWPGWRLPDASLSSTSGAACATGAPPPNRQSAAVMPIMRMRVSRSRPPWPRAGSSPSRPGCSADRGGRAAFLESLLAVAQERLRVGNGNEQAVAQARATVGTYRDALLTDRICARPGAARARASRGRYLVRGDRRRRSSVADAASVPVGMPSQLLERRPDVVAAERRVAAAFNRVGEARAAQLPRISLTAGGSSVSSALIELKDTSNPIWSFGGNLIAPLYQGGALRAQVEIRSPSRSRRSPNTRARAAGVRRTSRCARGGKRAERSRTPYSRRPSATANARWSSRASSIAWCVDLRTVEQSQLALYSARTARLRVQSERLAQRVNLYLALGGGFDMPAMEPVAAQ